MRPETAHSTFVPVISRTDRFGSPIRRVPHHVTPPSACISPVLYRRGERKLLRRRSRPPVYGGAVAALPPCIPPHFQERARHDDVDESLRPACQGGSPPRSDRG